MNNITDFVKKKLALFCLPKAVLLKRNSLHNIGFHCELRTSRGRTLKQQTLHLLVSLFKLFASLANVPRFLIEIQIEMY